MNLDTVTKQLMAAYGSNHLVMEQYAEDQIVITQYGSTEVLFTITARKSDNDVSMLPDESVFSKLLEIMVRLFNREKIEQVTEITLNLFSELKYKELSILDGDSGSLLVFNLSNDTQLLVSLSELYFFYSVILVPVDEIFMLELKHHMLRDGSGVALFQGNPSDKMAAAKTYMVYNQLQSRLTVSRGDLLAYMHGYPYLVNFSKPEVSFKMRVVIRGNELLGVYPVL